MDKKDAPKAAPEPATPVAAPVQEYPKMLYHADGRQLTVASKDEEAAATKNGFADTPQSPAEPKRRG